MYISIKMIIKIIFKGVFINEYTRFQYYEHIVKLYSVHKIIFSILRVLISHN